MYVQLQSISIFQKHALDYINAGEPKGLDAYIKKNENARKESTEFTQPGPTQRIAKKEHWIDRYVKTKVVQIIKGQLILKYPKNQRNFCKDFYLSKLTDL